MAKGNRKYRQQKREFLESLACATGAKSNVATGDNAKNIASTSLDHLFASESSRNRTGDAQREAYSAKKSCTSKNRYSSKSEAQAAIFACAEHGRTGLSCYKCERCNGWHLTSHPWEN